MNQDLIEGAAKDFHSACVKATKAGWSKEYLARHIVSMARKIKQLGVSIEEETKPTFADNVIPFPNPEEIE
jgi:hypothetical protein